VALGDRVCVGAAFADYDNDGDQDLFVTSTRGGNVLFRNDGDGAFTDVTGQAGVGHVAHSQMPCFFDSDNDGDLDLLVLQTARWTTEEYNEAGRHFAGKETIALTAGSEKEYNLLYRNDGEGRFTEVGEKAGLRGLGWAADAAVFDHDGDGLLDVLLTNMFGRAQLYRSRGDGTFADVTLAVLGKTSFGGMGVKAFDFHNDGRLDVYMVDMHSDMWATPETDRFLVEERKRYPYLLGRYYDLRANPEQAERELADLVRVKYDEVLFGNAAFSNLGGGRFEEVSERANLETFWPWGIAAGDFDNDGREDAFVTAGMGYPFFYWPNSLLLNQGDGTFRDRAAEAGVEPPPGGKHLPAKIGGRVAVRSSRSAAAADFDGDGRLDLVVNNFNDHPYLFRNHFPRQNYVAFRLTGTRSNRDAVGALVRLYAGDEVMVRQVHAAGGYLAQSSMVVHFGLGDRTKIDRVEVRWPGGLTQRIEAPEINAVIPLTEPRE
jgi:hypothetical protein